MLKHTWLGAVALGAAALAFSSTPVTAAHKIVICHNDLNRDMSVVMSVTVKSSNKYFERHGNTLADKAYLGIQYRGLGCGA